MKSLKRVYKLANRIVFLFFWWWVLETIFFLIRDGWHWQAECNAEKVCDKIFVYGFQAAGFLYIICFFKLMDLITKKPEQ